jgi:hypothetical protein
MSRSLTLVAGLAVALPASGQGCDPLVVGVMEAVDAVCSCVVEETAFVADYDGKLMISNVRHPALPVPMGELVTTGRPNALAVHGSVAYVSNIDPDTVDIVDISQPWAPVLLGTIPLAVTGMEVVDGMLYAIAIGDGLDALHVFDLGVPQTPQEIGTLMLPDGPRGLTIDGDYAYMTLIAGLGGDLAIADIKDPANPLLVSVLPHADRPARDRRRAGPCGRRGADRPRSRDRGRDRPLDADAARCAPGGGTRAPT